MTQCPAKPLAFSSLSRRCVEADFDGGHLTSDGGALLRREVDRRLRLTERLAACLTDPRDTTADTKYPVANPHQGKFRAEVSRYLANTQYTGASAKAWYLLADPKDLPVIEVAFLNGQESPTIETAEADFNRLGVQMRGYHDFGVALQDQSGTRLEVPFTWHRGEVTAVA